MFRLLAISLLGGAAAAQTVPSPPGTTVQDALFALHEIDMHLHSGMERPVDMEEWLDMAVADGRKVVAMVDHLELYRQTPEEYEQWRAGRFDQPPYELGVAGHEQFFAQVDRMAANRDDLIIFKGWEISEKELTDMDLDAMRLVDVIGWHISPNNGGEAPDGEHLIMRVEQVKKAQAEVPVPMILFHPFTMRIENIQRTAEKAGRDVASITAEEYRFFDGDEQERLAKALAGQSIYIEMARRTGRYLENPACREALIADLLPLAEMGVQFTVSTDAHGVGSYDEPFEPETFCKEVGCTPANTNTIIRELLAQRAKNELRRLAQ